MKITKGGFDGYVCGMFIVNLKIPFLYAPSFTNMTPFHSDNFKLFLRVILLFISLNSGKM